MSVRRPRSRSFARWTQTGVYAWERARIERDADQRISDDQLFENLLRGYAPGSGDAYVSLLQILDRGAKKKAQGEDVDAALRAAAERRRKVAFWASHLYADLDARAYSGITLWRAWHATDVEREMLDVPDVDAIPFAKLVLGETSWKSPIPADRRRAALYERIRKSMHAYRVQRELREVAAAAWLTAAPKLDRDLRRIVPRMHQLWAECEDDPARMARRLAAVVDRNAFLRSIDEAADKDVAVYEARSARRRRLVNSASRIKKMARALLQARN